jgi:hypothetical protein
VILVSRLRNAIGAHRARRRSDEKYRKAYELYRQQLIERHDWRLQDFAISFGGDRSVHQKEYINHYDVFSHYAYREIAACETSCGRAKVFDIGSCRMFLGMVAVRSQVDALNLNNPQDHLTGTRYIVCDIADYDPWANGDVNNYDFVTSTVSFHLLGLGRYGDKVDCNAQAKFIEICRALLKPGGKVLLSCSLGRDGLDFNNGWVFSVPSLKRMFSGFALTNGLVDTNSYGSVDPTRDPATRFVNIVNDLEFAAYKYRGTDGSSIPNDVAFLTFAKL